MFTSTKKQISLADGIKMHKPKATVKDLPVGQSSIELKYIECYSKTLYGKEVFCVECEILSSSCDIEKQFDKITIEKFPATVIARKVLENNNEPIVKINFTIKEEMKNIDDKERLCRFVEAI